MEAMGTMPMTKHVTKQTAAKATLVLAGLATALVLAAALLAALGARGGGADGLTAAGYDEIVSKAKDRIETDRAANAGAGETEAGSVYLDAVAARLAMATDIPLDPPKPEEPKPDEAESDEAEQAEPEQPKLTPEEVAQRRAERERELMAQQPSAFRYLGRLVVGSRSVALLASDAGQTTVSEGASASVRIKQQQVRVKVVSVEDDRVELIEATTQPDQPVDLESYGIPRTIERAARTNPFAAAQDDATNATGGRDRTQANRRSREQQDDRADLTPAQRQRQTELREKLRSLGFSSVGTLDARQLRTAEGLARNLERALETRPDPSEFEGGASNPDYRQQFENWNRGVNNLRSRIREIIGQG